MNNHHQFEKSTDQESDRQILLASPTTDAKTSSETQKVAAPSNVEGAVALFDKEAKKKTWRYLLCVSMGLPVILYPLYCMLFAFLDGPFLPWVDLSFLYALLIILGGLLGGALGYLGGKTMISRRQKEAAGMLVQQEAVEGIGPLMEVLEFQGGMSLWNRAQREQAVAALVRLLPRLRANESIHLTKLQRKMWYRAMSQYNLEFAQASLAALVQVGDRAAIPAVRRIALRFPVLAQEASVCLQALQDRTPQEANRLLRPAHAPGASSQTLLRPAGHVGESDSGLLLRPVQDIQGDQEK